MRRHTPRVFQIASRFFRQRAQVEEAAQEAFLRAYTQLSRFEQRGSFEGWLTRLTINLCLNLLRSAQARPESTVSNFSENETEWIENKLADVSVARYESEERGLIAADLAEKVLSRMTGEERFILMSIDGDEMSIKEVAAMTGWSESKVKVRAFRARRKMREAVETLLGRGNQP